MTNIAAAKDSRSSRAAWPRTLTQPSAVISKSKGILLLVLVRLVGRLSDFEPFVLEVGMVQAAAALEKGPLVWVALLLLSRMGLFSNSERSMVQSVAISPYTASIKRQRPARGPVMTVFV
jgi:hypothetical protein